MVLGVAVVIALICGFFFRRALINSMSNVRVAQEAQEYLKMDSVNITTNIDTYLYTNISVIPKDNHADDKNQPVDDNNDNNDADDNDSGDSDSGGSDN